MASKVVIADISSGFENDIPAFKLNNEAFETLENFFVWRNRVLRKRGTSFLGRLRRDLTTKSLTSISLSGSSPNNFTFGNLLTPSQSQATVIPGNISNITLTIGAQILTDTTGSGTFVIGGGPGSIISASISYSTGIITISFTVPAGPLAVTFTGSYYPNLPVMGCENFQPNNPLSSNNPINYPVPLVFDTVYSYQYNFSLLRFYDVSFYKITGKPLIWSGQNYQQFWSCSYYNATWVTNGKPGFHFATIVGIIANQTSTTITLTLSNSTLINGDRLWFNELQGTTVSINNQTGTVTDASSAPTYVVTFTTSQTINTHTSGTGIAQLLTSSVSGQDGIRWYDGDPTASSSVGWVNFAPPLSDGNTEIAGFTSAQYYLIGAVALLPFKDRLLAFGATIRTSASSQEIYLSDTVIYSQVGTPFYNSLVPINKTAPSDSAAWYNNEAGRGGDISAGINEPILSVGNNEDVLIIGFPSRQTRFVYTSNDFFPFAFYSINSERGADATFASVSLDRIVYNIGPYGFTETKQTNVDRIDLKIPDEIFAIKSQNNGIQRICGVRDFRNEYIFFTVPYQTSQWNFPTKTFLYNYLNQTWSILDENFTTYGQFWDQTVQTWANNSYESGWSSEETWQSSSNVTRYPSVIGGNQQGFVVIKNVKDVGEGISQYISTFSYSLDIGSNPQKQTVTIGSPNHCLTVNDYIRIESLTGISNISSNNYKVTSISADNFTTSHPPIDNETDLLSGTYNGNGVYARLVIPLLQTKQFQPFWQQGKQVRLGTSRFLFDRTQEGEVTAQIYVSQNSDFPVNDFPEFPDVDDSNNSIIFSDIISTSVEENNLNTISSYGSTQIWHRMSSSVVGSSVQIGITLSENQMKDQSISNEEISLHQMVLDVYPSYTLI